MQRLEARDRGVPVEDGGHGLLNSNEENWAFENLLPDRKRRVKYTRKPSNRMIASCFF